MNTKVPTLLLSIACPDLPGMLVRLSPFFADRWSSVNAGRRRWGLHELWCGPGGTEKTERAAQKPAFHLLTRVPAYENLEMDSRLGTEDQYARRDSPRHL